MRQITLIAAMLAMFGGTELTAQVGATATITIPELLYVDIDVKSVPFAEPTLADWQAGSIAAPASTVTTVSTRANVSHQVLIAADAELMDKDGVADVTTSKPASDLEWSTDGTTFSPLTTTGVAVTPTLSRGVHATAGTVYYQMLLDESTDEPGIYSLGFTFTVLAN